MMSTQAKQKQRERNNRLHQQRLQEILEFEEMKRKNGEEFVPVCVSCQKGLKGNPCLKLPDGTYSKTCGQHHHKSNSEKDKLLKQKKKRKILEENEKLLKENKQPFCALCHTDPPRPCVACPGGGWFHSCDVCRKASELNKVNAKKSGKCVQCKTQQTRPGKVTCVDCAVQARSNMLNNIINRMKLEGECAVCHHHATLDNR